MEGRKVMESVCVCACVRKCKRVRAPKRLSVTMTSIKHHRTWVT